jgi:hypothetical protein
MTLPLSPEQLHEVTSQVGFAVWQIQVLGRAVGAYLVLVHKATLAIARAEVETMFAKAGKSTLGQLLREIRAAEDAPQHLIDQLDGFVPKRNWLVHHSRHESHKEMYSAAGRTALIARIEAIADEALALMKSFDAATEEYLETRGISKEEVNRRTAELLAEWMKGA